jgi:hypothetical protein
MTTTSPTVLVDDINLLQGDDRPLVWTLADSAGAPVNLDGYTALAQVRAQPQSTTVWHEWSTDDGTAVLADSSISLKVDDSETWTWHSGVYDLHLIDFAGRTEVIARGKITLLPAVTR